MVMGLTVNTQEVFAASSASLLRTTVTETTTRALRGPAGPGTGGGIRTPCRQSPVFFSGGHAQNPYEYAEFTTDAEGADMCVQTANYNPTETSTPKCAYIGIAGSITNDDCNRYQNLGTSAIPTCYDNLGYTSSSDMSAYILNQNSDVGAENYWYEFTTFESTRKYYLNSTTDGLAEKREEWRKACCVAIPKNTDAAGSDVTGFNDGVTIATKAECAGSDPPCMCSCSDATLCDAVSDTTQCDYSSPA
eukprot:g3918.t1